MQLRDVILESEAGSQQVDIPVRRLVIAGWTGRDKDAMEKHITELEEMGVARPTSTPMFYRVSADRLTTADSIQVAGNDSSGEVEFVLVNLGGVVWVGVGSDHTDRKVETYGVTYSKQICDKPMANVLWKYADLRDHWDDLELRSYAITDDSRLLYQEGSVKQMLHPEDTLKKFKKSGDSFTDGDVMFCGTLPTLGGLSVAERFEFELYDPKTDKRNGHSYEIATLPIHG